MKLVAAFWDDPERPGGVVMRQAWIGGSTDDGYWPTDRRMSQEEADREVAALRNRPRTEVADHRGGQPFPFNRVEAVSTVEPRPSPSARLVLPPGMTEQQAREMIDARLAESHAADERSLQVLGAAMVREHARLAALEDRFRGGAVSAHDVSEAARLLADLRHEIGRAAGHLSSRAALRERWLEKRARLEGAGEGAATQPRTLDT